MAFKESYEYAKFAHGHNYSDFWFFPSFGPQSKNKSIDVDYTNPASCDLYGVFNVTKYGPGIDVLSTNSISVYAPKQVVVSVDQTINYNPHTIGDLQHFTMTNCTFETYLTGNPADGYCGYKLDRSGAVANIDIYSSSFDGWVVPNGKTYSCGANDFKAACRIFSGSETATSFTVPNLYSFVSCNPANVETNAIEQRSCRNGVAPHMHQLQTSYFGTDDPLRFSLGQFAFTTSSTSSKQVANFVHGATGTDDNTLKKTTITIDLITINAIINGITVNDSMTADETYPKHFIMPTLIYIGEK